MLGGHHRVAAAYSMNHFSSLLVCVVLLPIALRGAALLEKPAVVVRDIPPVQMLVPGFTVRELPVQLRNLNNLVYAPDGRLFALGYDGNVYQLTDTDGDGLEDQATLFFNNDRGEIPPSIGMAWGPRGLYIAYPSSGQVPRKVTAFRDFFVESMTKSPFA